MCVDVCKGGREASETSGKPQRACYMRRGSREEEGKRRAEVIRRKDIWEEEEVKEGEKVSELY